LRFSRTGFAVFLALVLSGFAPAQDAAPWTRVGPDGGDARSLAADPADPDHIFLGTSAGQLFVSQDGGASWRWFAHLGAGDDYVLDDIVISPADGTIYVAAWSVEQNTGDVYRSRDRGRSWQELRGIHGKSVRSLAMAANDARVLVAGALDGVFRSHDGGESWERISPEGHPELKNIESLAVDPRDAKVIYAGTWHLPWKTEDGGGSWHSMKQGIIDDSDVFSIIVDGADSSVVYASACSGIYKSQSAGASFRKVQGIPATARRTRVLRQDPLHPEIVYAGTTEGLWRTSDAGTTFQRISAANIIVNDVLVDARRPARVLVATDRSGVLASSDRGTTFAASNRGFAHRQVQTLIADNRVPAVLYAGVINDKEFGGVFVSRDAGASWQQMSTGLGKRDVFVLRQLADGTLLAGTNGGVMVWKRNSRLWMPVGTVTATASRGRRVPVASGTPFRARVNDFTIDEGRIWAATSDGIFHSDDAGRSWHGGALFGWHDFIAVRAQRGLVAAITPQQFLLTRDRGASWSPLSVPSYVTAINGFEIAPGSIWLATREGALRSFDDGEKWEHVLNGLPHKHLLSIVYDDEGRRLLATSAGTHEVFESRDNGHSWQSIAAGWRVRGVLPLGGRVLARTAYDGVVVQPAPTAAAAAAGSQQ
jgi:photosystem II stability/assembly factor-like uncharacterized protein